MMKVKATGYKEGACERLLGKAYEDLLKAEKIILDLGIENETLKARLDWADRHPVKVQENHFLGRFYWPAMAYCEVQPCHI